MATSVLARGWKETWSANLEPGDDIITDYWSLPRCQMVSPIGSLTQGWAKYCGKV